MRAISWIWAIFSLGFLFVLASALMMGPPTIHVTDGYEYWLWHGLYLWATTAAIFAGLFASSLKD